MSPANIVSLALDHAHRSHPNGFPFAANDGGFRQVDFGVGEFRYIFEGMGYIMKVYFPELDFTISRERNPVKSSILVFTPWEWSGEKPPEETLVLLRLALL